MKIAIECKSPLMQKSMEMFLREYLATSSRNCDIVVRDEKCLKDKRCFYVSTSKDADLTKPFSKAQLILALESRYKSLDTKTTVKSKDEDASQEVIGIEILEKRIKYLTQEYQDNILKAVRAFYEE